MATDRYNTTDLVITHHVMCYHSKPDHGTEWYHEVSLHVVPEHIAPYWDGLSNNILQSTTRACQSIPGHITSRHVTTWSVTKCPKMLQNASFSALRQSKHGQTACRMPTTHHVMFPYLHVRSYHSISPQSSSVIRHITVPYQVMNV